MLIQTHDLLYNNLLQQWLNRDSKEFEKTAVNEHINNK